MQPRKRDNSGGRKTVCRMAVEDNDELVDLLVDRGYIETGRVEAAFRAVDRKDFVPESQRGRAYQDAPLPIAGGATISAPHMVAMNTELLEVEDGDSVIEIGSGSGYQLAILSELAKEAIGVELIEDLVEKSRERLSSRDNVEVLEGSGFQPVEDRYGDTRFDRVLYSCAIDSLEDAREHLAEDGIAVAPVQTAAGQVLKRLKEGEVEEHGRVRFVPFQED